jgi:hypothetical protein
MLSNPTTSFNSHEGNDNASENVAKNKYIFLLQTYKHLHRRRHHQLRWLPKKLVNGEIHDMLSVQQSCVMIATLVRNLDKPEEAGALR